MLKDIFTDASVLKLGMSYPLPEKTIREFASKVDKLLVIEELDPLIETQVKAWGIECHGRDFVPGIGELTPGKVRDIKNTFENSKSAIPQSVKESEKDFHQDLLCFVRAVRTGERLQP